MVTKEELERVCETVTERLANGYIVNVVQFNDTWDIIQTFHVARVALQKNPNAECGWSIHAWDRNGKGIITDNFHVFWVHDPDRYKPDHTDVLPQARRSINLPDFIKLSEQYD
jgi:hypothetical protein